MQPINMIMIYNRDKKLQKRLYVLEADIITIKKNIDLMSSWKNAFFFRILFQMTTIVFISVINHDHINGLHLFWNTLYVNVWLECSNLAFKLGSEYSIYLSF